MVTKQAKEKIMNKKITLFLVGIVMVIGLIAGTGCATKKYVMGEVATIDQKVEGVETSVEENQKRIREHDERLATLGSLIKEQESEIGRQRTEFDSKLSEVKKAAEGKLIFQQVLENDEAKFGFDSWDLSEDAKAVLDKFVEMLIAQDKGVYLEIQGHTDSTGEEDWNLILGKRRADAVMEYLHKKYSIPLHRMEVISYGSSAPVGDNSTREGRAQNRRVVILVYE
jgi:outer membrane protein OmpA-like peptidoglycan-associated protein